MLRQLLPVILGLCLLLPGISFGAAAVTDFEVHFGLNSARLIPGEVPQIARLADYLRQHPQVAVTLAGHADNTGPQALNVRLSHDRAAAVRDLLVEDFGISKGRVGIAWLDSSRPVASNDSGDGRARNRRVGIAFLSGNGQAEPAAAAAPRALNRRSQPRPRTAMPSRPVVASPRKPAGTPEVVKERRDVRNRLILTYLEGATRPAAGETELAGLATEVKQDPALVLQIDGVTGGGGADLLLARRRVDAIRVRMVYGFKVPARQVRVGWTSDAGAGTDVGVLLQVLAAK